MPKKHDKSLLMMNQGKPSLLARRFTEIWRAHLCVGIGLTLWLGVYASIHFLWPAQKPDWSRAVQLANDGTFRAIYRENELERFFARNKINEFKQLMEEKGQALRTLVIGPRRALLEDAGQLIRNGLRQETFGGLFSKPLGTAGENEYLTESLVVLSNKLARLRAKVTPERQDELSVVLAMLGAQIDYEEKLRDQLKVEVNGLKPILSFDWLYYEDWLWLVELFFWSVLGVIVNTMIKLIRVGRTDKYDPDEFVLMFPKLLLSPFLAVVFVALWTSGFTESKVEFLNLPMLLVIFFLLGFATESLYDKIIGVAEIIITPMTNLSQAKLTAAASRERYQYRFFDMGGPPPKTIVELQERAQELAKCQIERGLVTRLPEATGRQT